MPRTGRRRQVDRSRWCQFRHMLTAALLETVVAVDAEGKKAIGHLRALIEEKNLVSYSGEIYRREDIRRMGRHLDRYRAWADRLLAV